MALSKDRAAITQLTATGTSTTLDVSASYGHTLYLRHSNGTGTPSTIGSVRVQAKPSGGTFIDVAPYSFSAVATEANSYPCLIPDDAVSVQLIYTAPAGTTGHTLDAEVGRITSL